MERAHGGARGVDGLLDGLAGPARRLAQSVAVVEFLADVGRPQRLADVAGVARRHDHRQRARQRRRAARRRRRLRAAPVSRPQHVTIRYRYDKGKGKVFPYSLPSVGPGADPGVQAVSPQVT